MIMRASFVEGIGSMVRVRICSKGSLIAPLVGAMDHCFLIQHALQRDNQKSIWWRTAGSNSAIANKVTVRRAEVSLFPLRLRFDCIRPLDGRVVHGISVVPYLYYFINQILSLIKGKDGSNIRKTWPMTTPKPASDCRKVVVVLVLW